MVELLLRKKDCWNRSWVGLYSGPGCWIELGLLVLMLLEKFLSCFLGWEWQRLFWGFASPMISFCANFWCVDFWFWLHCNSWIAIKAEGKIVEGGVRFSLFHGGCWIWGCFVAGRGKKIILLGFKNVDSLFGVLQFAGKWRSSSSDSEHCRDGYPKRFGAQNFSHISAGELCFDFLFFLSVVDCWFLLHCNG